MILVGRLRSAMPMEFLMDAQVAGYGRFVGVPSRSDLERFFVLDSVDRDLLGDRRGDHNRLGFMVQAATVRYIGVFLKDPVDVPLPVLMDQLPVDSHCAMPCQLMPLELAETGAAGLRILRPRAAPGASAQRM